MPIANCVRGSEGSIQVRTTDKIFLIELSLKPAGRLSNRERQAFKSNERCTERVAKP
jgi:hypothetical protein